MAILGRSPMKITLCQWIGVLGKILTGNHRFPMKIMGFSAYTNFPKWGFMNIQKWGFIHIHKITPKKTPPFLDIHRSPMVIPHENPVDTLPADTSIRPKTFSALRHSLAFSQALTTAPQVTSVDYGSAAWCWKTTVRMGI
jgi:hypothetical protein